MVNDIISQDPRQIGFLAAVKELNLRFETAEISKATGYKQPIISEYLNNKKLVSEKFLHRFCEAFALDYADVIYGKGNHPYVKDKKPESRLQLSENPPKLDAHQNDIPMINRMLDLLEKQYSGLLEAHKDLISKIEHVAVKDEKKREPAKH